MRLNLFFKIRFFAVVFLSSFAVYGQDPQFSQLYAIPLYMGPSFAGSTGGTRVALNFRDQWPAVDKEFISYSASVDHYFQGTSNGIGGIIYRDHAGLGSLTTSNLSMQYAYSFNVNRIFSIRPGVQFSLVNRHIDYSKIVFGDQLSLDGIKPVSIEPEQNQNINYFDFATSLLANHPNFWIGVNADHLTQPNQSLLGEKSKIPVKINVFGGVKYMVKKRAFGTYRRNIYAAFQYKQQAEYKQAYLGFYWENNNIMTGLWYRGIPFYKTFESYLNNDAMVFLLGYKYGEFTFGYSYDFTTSRFTSNSGGAHEISVTWVRIKPKKQRKEKWNIISCPAM